MQKNKQPICMELVSYLSACQTMTWTRNCPPCPQTKELATLAGLYWIYTKNQTTSVWKLGKKYGKIAFLNVPRWACRSSMNNKWMSSTCQLMWVVFITVKWDKLYSACWTYHLLQPFFIIINLFYIYSSFFPQNQSMVYPLLLFLSCLCLCKKN